jgi:hypothetical protein
MAKPKQEVLPGMPKGIPELEAIGIEIGELDEASWKSRERRDFLVGKGLEEMHKHNLTSYKVEAITLTIVPGVDKLKVSTKKEESRVSDDA